MKICLVGNFTQQHCSENHWALTLEDMQHQVTRLQENELKPGSLPSLVAGHDLFIWVRTWEGFVTENDLVMIRSMGILSVNLHLDAFVGLGRERSLDTDPRWRCDYVFTPDGDPRSAEIFKQHSINHFYLKPGVYKAECEYGTYRPELAHDVVFVGGGLEYMHPEWPYRRELVRWLMDNYKGNRTTAVSLTGQWPNTVIPRFGKYGHPQRVMRNQDLNDLYASAKIAIGDSVCIGFKHERYWSDRLTETLGRGGFIIHPYIKGLEEEFTLDGPDKNLVTYEYGNFDQLRELIDYYLTHEDEREALRKAGHEFVKSNCTYHERLQQMLNTVFPPAPVPNTVADAPAPATRIYLGSGNDHREGYVHVDVVDLPNTDVVHNVMDFPWPFETESADEILAIDLIEHIPTHTTAYESSYVKFLEEAHRILRPGGLLYIQTPGVNADFAFIDFTHVKAFHPRSFDLVDPTTDLGRTTGFYTPVKFSVRSEELPNGNLRFWLTKLSKEQL